MANGNEIIHWEMSWKGGGQKNAENYCQNI